MDHQAWVREAAQAVGAAVARRVPGAPDLASRIEGRLRGEVPEGPTPVVDQGSLPAVAAAFREADGDGRLRPALDEELLALALAAPPTAGHSPSSPDSSERARVVFEEAPVAILVLDAEGRVVDANTAHLRMMGLDAAAPYPRLGDSVRDLPTAQEPKVRGRLEGLLRGEPFDLRDYTLTSPYSNRVLRLNVRGVPLCDGSGALKGAMILTEDVTEEAELGEQLVRAQKMESLGTLAGGIAHEFNNLLSGILGHASLLRSRIPTSDTLQRQVTRVEESAHRAAELTQQLMAFSRDTEPERKVIDAGQLLRELGSLLDRTMPANVRVRVERADLDTRVEANRTQLQQALLNVCSNARDAMTGGGELRLAVGATTEAPACLAGAPARRWVTLRIEDTGHGMEDAVLRRAFDPFFTTKPPGQGTGLGLAITYRIVESHGGAMDVRSAPGHGTVVDIWLPASDRIPDPATPRSPGLRAGTGTILVVDDEPVLLELMTDILGELGYEILLAEDGVEAMDIYDMRWRSIDLVLLDVVMPRMGGRETLNAMRSLNPDVRVVLCSGYLRQTDLDAFPMEGVLGFLRKPYDREQVAGAVARALG